MLVEWRMTPLNVKNSWITYVHAHSILLTRFIPFCPPTYSTSLDNLPSQNPNGAGGSICQRRNHITGIHYRQPPPFTRTPGHPHSSPPPPRRPRHPPSRPVAPPLPHQPATFPAPGADPRSPRPAPPFATSRAIFCVSSSFPPGDVSGSTPGPSQR